MLYNVLIAVAVVSGIGLVCGIVLALASHFMAVKTDEKKEAVRGCLPGVNCGACGYTGCDGYAAALAKGEAEINLCIPGADAVAKKLAEVLGVDFADVVEKVAFVRCGGDCKATEKKQIYDGVKSCAAANLIYGGTGKCTFGCLGYGDCAAVCQSDAVCITDGIAHISATKCIGCGMCVKACPKHIITLVPDVVRTVVMCSNKEKGAVTRKECTSGCIACKKCERLCPAQAITVNDNLAVIDIDKCTGCGVCSDNCPVGCIKSGTFLGANNSKQ